MAIKRSIIPEVGLMDSYEIVHRHLPVDQPPSSFTYIVFRLNGGYMVKDGKTGVIEGVEWNLSQANRVIQWAIDNLPANGGKIFLSEGEFNISTEISINKANVTLEGCGLATLIKAAENVNCISISAHNARIQNLQLRGTNNTGIGINLIPDPYETRIWNCYIWDFNYGIYNAEQHNLVIRNNRIKGCNYGIRFIAGHDILIEGNDIETCSTRAISVERNTEVPYSYVIIGNLFEDGADRIAYFRGLRMNISGNTFNRGPTTTDEAVRCEYSYYCVFANNLIGERSGTRGFAFMAGNRNLIANNVCQSGSSEADMYIHNETKPVILNNMLLGNGVLKFRGGYEEQWVFNNFIPGGYVIEANIYGASHFFRNNPVLETESFKATGLSVTIGVNDVYGDPIAITTRSGLVTYPRVKITWGGTFGAGETVTVKVSAIYLDGTSTFIERSATGTGTAWLTDDEIMSLITEGKDIRRLEVQAKTNLASTTVTVSVDSFGKA